MVGSNGCVGVGENAQLVMVLLFLEEKVEEEGTEVEVEGEEEVKENIRGNACRMCYIIMNNKTD